jgi:hypothetical protein
VELDWMDCKPYLIAVPEGFMWAEADNDYKEYKNTFLHHQHLVSI